MTEQTAAVEREGFTAETFARFWAKPDLSTPSDDLSDDVIGYWPARTSRYEAATSMSARSRSCWPVSRI
jgi:hypothetical protein